MKDKQWYVDQHRAMWNWIADQIEKSQKVKNINDLKKRWCKSHKVHPVHDCFSCEYDARVALVQCKCCLFDWGVPRCEYSCEDGYYGSCRYLYCNDDWKKQAELARKVANLPVREEV